MRRGPRAKPGFSLVEVALATVIVGGLLVAAMNLAGAAASARQLASDRSRAVLLAEALLNECMAMPYADPDGSATLGPDPDESTGSRAAFDDVDDYDGWKESPPADRTGGELDGYPGWTRECEVDWVNATEPARVSATETGVKRITVTVSRRGQVVSRVLALRTAGVDAAEDDGLGGTIIDIGESIRDALF